MTGAMVVVENGTPMQPLVATFIQLMFLLVVLKMAPYNDDLDDWSSFVCSLALMLTTLGGFLLMMWKQQSEDTVISVELLTTLLMVINGLCFAYEMLVIGYVAYQDRVAATLLKKTQKKENSNNNSPTKVQPVNNVFLLEEEDDEDGENDDAPDPLIDLLVTADEDAEKTGAASSAELRSWNE